MDLRHSDRSKIRVLKVLPGKAFGLRQPVLIAHCRFSTRIQIGWDKVDALMAELLPSVASSEPNRLAPWETQLLARVGSWTFGVQADAGLPVFEAPVVIRLAVGVSAGKAILAIPYAPDRHLAAVSSLQWAWNCIEVFEANEGQISATTRSNILGSTERLLQSLGDIAPKNSNSLRFLKAAHDRGTPWELVTRNIYQFGWGQNARLMEGAFTDAAGMIGAGLARNKDACAELLRRIGLPAPMHKRVNSPDASEQAAMELGYPVVVKPADLDGGLGVAANLQTPGQVRAAYLAASKVSKRILVEKHATGKDYRLVVFNGELIWTILRQPGGVTGDGIHTVRQLVDILNAEPIRGTGPRAPLKRVKLDDEAEELLSESGMSPESIAPPQLFVRLRRTANVATGGTPIAVNEQVHPDNRQLAIDIADAVRLDLVGLDVLIEDISKSWHEVGATVCEVNGDPQLGIMTQQHLYGDLIGSLCGGLGRIPAIVIVGAGRAKIIAGLVAASLSAQGLMVGMAEDASVSAAGQEVTRRASSIFMAAQMLLARNDVEIALVAIEDHKVLATSLPFDRIDLLVVADRLNVPKPNALARIVQMIAANSVRILADNEVSACRDAVSGLEQANVSYVSGGEQTIASAIIEAVDANQRQGLGKLGLPLTGSRSRTVGSVSEGDFAGLAPASALRVAD